MVLEFLVIGLCSVGANCSKASEAYYAGNPDLQKKVAQMAKSGQNAIGETGTAIVAVIAPATSIATGHTASFKINNHFSLEVGGKQQKMMIEWHF